ncbi:MAG TPA: hypothetical protein VGM56_29740, partial [Byssovorax sp.]
MNTFDLLLDCARGSLVLGAALVAMPLLARAPATARRAVLVAALALSVAAPLGARALRDTEAARYVAIPFVVRGAPVEPLVDGDAHATTTTRGHEATESGLASTTSDGAWAAMRRVDLTWAALAVWA